MFHNLRRFVFVCLLAVVLGLSLSILGVNAY